MKDQDQKIGFKESMKEGFHFNYKKNRVLGFPRDVIGSTVAADSIVLALLEAYYDQNQILATALIALSTAIISSSLIDTYLTGKEEILNKRSTMKKE